MRTSTRVLSLVVAVLLFGLTITAGVSLHRAQTFSLPIPRSTSISAILLPIITGISLLGGQIIAGRSLKPVFDTNSPVSWMTITVFVVLTIYEAVVATLAVTYASPPSSLQCLLDTQWQSLFTAKNENAIRAIQDAHHCCGLHSSVDRAYPFPVKGRPATACQDTFGREKSCFAGWRRDQQISAGLLGFVAVMSFVVKVIVLLYATRRATKKEYLQIKSHSSTRDKHSRLSKARAALEARYQDEPTGEDQDRKNHRAITEGEEEANGAEQRQGLAVQPSGLGEREREDRNVWES